MDPEPEEVIKQQMLETRASLAEKLETLEQQVVGTVHSATSAVTDTVGSVKEAVQDTMEMAKTSVHDTVDAVKETFDVSRHVRQHPWIMVGGSVAAGFAAGCLLERAFGGTPRGPTLREASPSAWPEPKRDGESQERFAEASRSTTGTREGSSEGEGGLAKKFETELNRLKGLALGTLFGVARDVIADAAPPQLSSELADIIDSVTLKLGGRPLPGPVFDMSERAGARSKEGAAAATID